MDRFIFIILFISSLFAEDAGVGFSANPSELTPQWCDFFDTEQKMKQFEAFTQEVIPTLTEEKRKEANELVKKITENYNSLVQLKARKAPLSPQSPPIADHYSINEILEIYKRKKQESIRLKNLKEERREKTSLLNSSQELVDKCAKIYFKKDSGTEEQFINGLIMINLHFTHEVERAQVEHLDKMIRAHEKYTKTINDELEHSIKNLTATQNELLQLKVQKETAEASWKKENKGNDGGEFDQNALNETEKHTAFLSVAIKEALAEFSLNDDPDPAAFLKQSRAWDKELQHIQQKIDDWTLILQKQVQRTTQLLALESAKEQEADLFQLQNQHANLLALEKLNNEINETFFLQKQLDNLISHKIGGPKKISVTVGNFYTRITETLSGILDAPLFHVGINPVTFWNLLKALLIFLLSLFAAKMLLNWIINLAYTRKNIDRSLLYRINRLFYYFLLVVMALLALSSIGLDFSNFLLVAGALGVGLGFGLQSIFNNFVSGLIMLFETHLKVGDFVEVASGVRGEIREINVRNTIISTNDGVDVIVPNSEMISNRVVNWTLKHPYRRVTVPFFVAYGTDKDLVAEVIKEGALKVPETLIKPGFSDPSVLIARYGDWRLEFELHVWVNEKYNKLPGKTISDYLWMIDDTLKKHNIEVPYKHLDISLK